MKNKNQTRRNYERHSLIPVAEDAQLVTNCGKLPEQNWTLKDNEASESEFYNESMYSETKVLEFLRRWKIRGKERMWHLPKENYELFCEDLNELSGFSDEEISK